MSKVLLGVLFCFWSALILTADGFVGWGIWHQIASRNYPAVSGEITHSELTREHGSKGGTSYGVDIRYSYTVDGREFDGTRYRYNAGASSDSAWAREAVASHPIGAATQVFYNPRNPQDALLSPGLGGADLFLVLFLMPFNLITFGLFAGAGMWLRGRILKPVAGGVKIITDGPRTTIRLPEYGAIAWGLAVMGALSFLSVFVLAFSSGSGFHPPVWAASAALALAVTAGAGGYGWQWRKVHSGEKDLVLHEGTRMLTLPETCGRKQLMSVGFSEIENLAVEAVTHHGNKGGVSYTYAPMLQLRGGGSQKLADWTDKKKAEACTDWLRQRVGIAEGPSKEVNR
jgi:hypothetical protein